MADAVADHQTARRPAWAPLVASAIVVPTVLAGLTLLWPRPQIEDELTRSTGSALSAAGFSNAGTSLSGRDASITGIPDGDRQRAIDTAQSVTGVRVADVPDGGTVTAPPAAAPAAPAPAAQPFGIARKGATIVLSGVVGSAEEKTQLVAAATAQAAGRSVVDQLTVAPGAPLPTGLDATSIGAATKAVAGVAGDVAVSVTGSGVTLTGTVADEAKKAAAAAAVTAALPGVTVDNQLTVAPAAAGTGALDAAGKQRLQGSITALLAAAPITFGPDSPQLTPQGQATVAKLVAILKPVPAAKVRVEGFVAGGRGNGKLTAAQLSEQRAGTVRAALVAGGVGADRITAVGRGEAPASAGAADRRVAITVV